ncbi:unnamed protein product [Lymnaea stagnalis]|uniref:C-type lectin domain-containing protein n=1 Tax=Lymnaea stagnalis TaxID=6523 RepID=A0AAV2H637_LYMST
MLIDVVDIPSLIILCSVFTVDLIYGSQFKLYNRDMASWSEGKQKCQYVGRNFAKVNSQSDQDAVELLSPYFTGFFWLGLKGNETNLSFTWSDDTPLEYTNWADGFPSLIDGKNCVRMRHFDNLWETFNCSERLNYLCQDPVVHKHYVVTMETKVKGVILGLCVMGGLVVLCCLVLQLPCCKTTAADKLTDITFLRTKDEENTPIT